MNELRKNAAAPAPDPINVSEDILRVDDLKMYFPVTKGLLKRTVGHVKAVDGVSFTIARGRTLGVVGESGCGKSTLGRCVMQRLPGTDGRIIFNGKDVRGASTADLRVYHRQMQMITQDPYAALDPRMSIRSIILEGAHIQGVDRGWTEQQKDDLVRDMLTMVGLNTRFADRYPHEFSGGQRQRINIARALAVSPSFLICDEIVSALDVSIQAQIVKLMMEIQRELGLTYIFIGHDLSVVRHVSDQVGVMYLGRFVELTGSDELYAKPLHPYTQALISAAPIPDPEVDATRERILLEGEVPSAINPPKGCNFCTRCPYATSRCIEEDPAAKEVLPGHFVACHRVKEGGEWISG